MDMGFHCVTDYVEERMMVIDTPIREERSKGI
jgi:hypothetical protein